MGPDIQVYTEFPNKIGLGSDLSVNLDSSKWYWVQCLTIPIDKLRDLQFSHRPFKWIRYAIGVIVGAQGDLSSSAYSLDIVDYNVAHLPERSIKLFYHLSDDEKRQMFPIDPRIAHKSMTADSLPSSRKLDFRSDVSEREGGQCVLSRLRGKIGCNAVHLVPHVKGDEYIAGFTKGRSRDPALGDVIDSIDSVRNGLYLNKLTHKGLGKHVAFLRTPNFAMDTVDVNSTAVALPGEERYTAHLFSPGHEYFHGGGGAPPSGTPIQISESPDWPPEILFDALYASTVLQHFGTTTFKKTVSRTWDRVFYPTGAVEDKAHADYYTQEWEEKQIRKREEVAAWPASVMIAMLRGTIPYMRAPDDDYLRSLEEKVEKAEKKRVDDKVETWRKQCS